MQNYERTCNFKEFYGVTMIFFSPIDISAGFTKLKENFRSTHLSAITNKVAIKLMRQTGDNVRKVKEENEEQQTRKNKRKITKKYRKGSAICHMINTIITIFRAITGNYSCNKCQVFIDLYLESI